MAANHFILIGLGILAESDTVLNVSKTTAFIPYLADKLNKFCQSASVREEKKVSSKGLPLRADFSIVNKRFFRK